MESADPQHFFSLEEVNALIPRLEEHFQNFWGMRQNAQNILQKLRKSLKEPQEQSPRDIADQQMRTSQAHFLLEQAKKELDTILEVGGVIKDLEIGLVDFPHISEYEEDEIYLCWKYGEKKVRFWHAIDEGYTSRKPLLRKFP
ncbi:MAG: DUF2203 domain-containing protein [Elusimicrobia bacterium]|nr:DUF2203 domain-containing protein [Elusimicrobiota bacterium]MBI3013213.1 DUF2203 domain-containing protein [Elusimicrobiota bacterium]MBI4217669.1 DUF2203 domain-containing protein [Elusimicrobiota bacterium]